MIRRKLSWETASAATLLVMLWAAATGAQTVEQKQGDPPQITVVGTGSVSAAPDLAEITLGVVTESPSAKDALSANNLAMQQLLGILQQKGLADKDVQTTGFDVSPMYEQDANRRQRPPRIVGYTVSNQVTIRVRKLDSFGEVLDAVVSVGANRVSGIRFSIDQPHSLLDEARQQAIDDAQRKASLLAERAGAHLGRVLAIRENFFEPRPVYGRAAPMAADAMSVPIAAGEQTLQASVQVTYLLEHP